MDVLYVNSRLLRRRRRRHQQQQIQQQQHTQSRIRTAIIPAPAAICIHLSRLNNTTYISTKSSAIIYSRILSMIFSLLPPPPPLSADHHAIHYIAHQYPLTRSIKLAIGLGPTALIRTVGTEWSYK